MDDIDAMMAEPMSTPAAATSGRCRGASSTSMFSEITLARVSQTGRHTHTRRRWIFGRDANCALCVYLLTGVSFVWNLEARRRRCRAVAAFDHGVDCSCGLPTILPKCRERNVDALRLLGMQASLDRRTLKVPWEPCV